MNILERIAIERLTFVSITAQEPETLYLGQQEYEQLFEDFLEGGFTDRKEFEDMKVGTTVMGLKLHVVSDTYHIAVY